MPSRGRGPTCTRETGGRYLRHNQSNDSDGPHLLEVSGIFPCRNGLFKHVHGDTCEIGEDVWFKPADVTTRDEVEHPGGEVLLVVLKVAVVE